MYPHVPIEAKSVRPFKSAQVSTASYPARNFDAEVQAYLNPPSSLAGLSMAEASKTKSTVRQTLEAKSRLRSRKGTDLATDSLVNFETVKYFANEEFEVGEDSRRFPKIP